MEYYSEFNATWKYMWNDIKRWLTGCPVQEQILPNKLICKCNNKVNNHVEKAYVLTKHELHLHDEFYSKILCNIYRVNNASKKINLIFDNTENDNVKNIKKEVLELIIDNNFIGLTVSRKNKFPLPSGLQFKLKKTLSYLKTGLIGTCNYDNIVLNDNHKFRVNNHKFENHGIINIMKTMTLKPSKNVNNYVKVKCKFINYGMMIFEKGSKLNIGISVFNLGVVIIKGLMTIHRCGSFTNEHLMYNQGTIINNGKFVNSGIIQNYSISAKITDHKTFIFEKTSNIKNSGKIISHVDNTDLLGMLNNAINGELFNKSLTILGNVVNKGKINCNDMTVLREGQFESSNDIEYLHDVCDTVTIT